MEKKEGRKGGAIRRMLQQKDTRAFMNLTEGPEKPDSLRGFGIQLQIDRARQNGFHRSLPAS